METYELIPRDGRLSFYGKARVIIDDNGNETLISYDTPVMQKINGELIRLWDDWSYTTGRHIKAFCGLNKKEYDKLPVAEKRFEFKLVEV